MKKFIPGLVMASTALFLPLSGFLRSNDRDIINSPSNGLNRIITVYTANGDILATYTGCIDIQIDKTNRYIRFEYDGNSIEYYNCYIEVIEMMNKSNKK